ncbi:hypothetical protein ILUMI_12545 [Ignelater luminosus]|uniref:Uncharacterized protein n=1 Tax=Ignelater luminosus TaxID=2038154 RepID=A0A8K0CW91_IGNLU|nr:hypothetical protein ILUMI_12545 [Ignelater luminosus]
MNISSLTISNLTPPLHSATKAMDDAKQLDVMYIDLTKTFGLRKLHSRGISDSLMVLLASYLSNFLVKNLSTVLTHLSYQNVAGDFKLCKPTVVKCNRSQSDLDRVRYHLEYG